MGLNIGIEVKHQREGYGEYGHNPKLDLKDLEQEFFAHLRKRFPKGGYGGGWVSVDEDVYDFDVRMFQYGQVFEENGYAFDDMYSAIFDFVLKHFSDHEIEARTYWSG